MTNEAPVLVEQSGHTLLITMNRPRQLNALTPEAYIRLAEAWYRYRDDGNLRAAILTGAGDRPSRRGRISPSPSHCSMAPGNPRISGRRGSWPTCRS